MTITEPPDGQWGGRSVLSDGSVKWTGMVSQLIHGEADMCGASLTITKEREEVIDFGIGLIEDLSSIYMSRQGQNMKINLVVYLTSFTETAWLCVLAIACLYAVQHVLINLPGGDDCKRDLAPRFVAGLYSFFLDLVQAHRGLSHGARLSSRIHMIASSITAFFLFSPLFAVAAFVMERVAKHFDRTF